MESNDIKISVRPAVRTDAPEIAKAIIEAVGTEITLDFAGGRDRIPLVYRLFTELAECEDSQYSYRNSWVAVAENGIIAGVIIGYDGSELKRLRERFIEKTKSVLGYDFKSEDMSDEASPDEFYLDSLCVFEPFRGRGIASRLIDTAVGSRTDLGKPVGLIVDKDNHRARKLYECLGFSLVGETPFAGTIMDHLQRGANFTSQH